MSSRSCVHPELGIFFALKTLLFWWSVWYKSTSTTGTGHWSNSIQISFYSSRYHVVSLFFGLKRKHFQNGILLFHLRIKIFTVREDLIKFLTPSCKVFQCYCSVRVQWSRWVFNGFHIKEFFLLLYSVWPHRGDLTGKRSSIMGIICWTLGTLCAFHEFKSICLADASHRAMDL